MIKNITFFLLILYIPIGFSEEKQNNTVIIKNEANSTTQSPTVTAPALVPSPAKKLRDVREKQEIKTEDRILRELEKQRLLDEQKRMDELLGRSSDPAPPIVRPQPTERWFFGNKAFISVGAGAVFYPGVTNVNSSNAPAIFGSFGGYGMDSRLIFDLSVSYSRHYLRTDRECFLPTGVVSCSSYNELQDVNRQEVKQPALSMSVKYSFLKGKIKPYAGLSSSIIGRKWRWIHKSGKPTKNLFYGKDVAEKEWYVSFDAGLAGGADIVLTKQLGVNVEARYHWNFYTENKRTATYFHYQVLAGKKVLDKMNSMILSANLRYYF